MSKSARPNAPTEGTALNVRRMLRKSSAERLSSEVTEAMLLDVREVASALHCSRRHIQRLADSGRMPAPLRLGCLVRWRRDEILQWIADGCLPIGRGPTNARPA